MAQLRVLLAHNTYQHKGGEDAVVEAESALLRQHGHVVVPYGRDNHDIDRMPKVAAALQTMWSTRTTNDIDALFASERPDLVHVHNSFPLISPSIYWAAARHGVPVVQTLHNFRLICPQAMLLREGKPCEDCVGKLPWRGVVHRCYRGSALQTAALATMLTGHRVLGTWSDRVTRYIALNEFCRERFIAGGLPAERIRVKPNFVDLPPPADCPREGFLFVGRLSEEKGIDVMISASALARLPQDILVAGTGPMAARVDAAPGIKPLGALASDEIYEQMSRSTALLLPSIWYENFPRTLVEAFACGLPVIASRLGAMAALVEDRVNGILFEAGNANDLAQKLVWAAENPKQMQVMGRNARACYERDLTADSNYRQLMAIYEEAIGAIKHLSKS